MIFKNYILLFFALSFTACLGQDTNNAFSIFDGKNAIPIVYDDKGTSLDSISAYLLANDIEKVTGTKPIVMPFNKTVNVNAILIGNVTSRFIKLFLKDSIPETFLKQRESFYHGVSKTRSNGLQHYIIAGTDARGTAFGVFNISEKIGVSPWYWWADVPVKKQEVLGLNNNSYFSQQPTVEYRGIFLNDEDWGLQPWAAKTFEKETGDIGPKTYQKIFELLLRLKANTIWPAMHPSTKAFFYYRGNPLIAQKYHIVIGTSHAEPMLRNNVDEWKETFGKFDYKNNKVKVLNYWEQRVKESKGLDAIYTMGIRGVHDSGMEGVSGIEEASVVLKDVIKDQRDMLHVHLGKPKNKIPQVFTVYKEVLELYDHGMEVPEDITLVWTDDNYGYIHRLSTPKEQGRAGGAGVYYHSSYWGRPHDYLWLCTTPPGLIKEEMLKAYYRNANKIWIVNVGDIKPGEYDMQLFLDMAYNITPFLKQHYLEEHSENFYSRIFGKEKGKSIASLKNKYYALAFERKPEYMGWSQTEPTTKVAKTAYTPFAFGDEINSRIQNYAQLGLQSDSIYKVIPKEQKNAYFQLIHYPVKGAEFMNYKHLYRDLALEYNENQRLIAGVYEGKSLAAHDSIKNITDRYNNVVSNGKWNGMMSMQPRNLPVFSKPDIQMQPYTGNEAAGFRVEGESGNTFPTFYAGFKDAYFIDVFLKEKGNVKWSLSRLPNWLLVSKKVGALDFSTNNLQERITFTIDWKKIGKLKSLAKNDITLKIGNKKYSIEIKLAQYPGAELHEKYFYEKNGFVVAPASGYEYKEDTQKSSWQEFKSLGYSGTLMQGLPLNTMPLDTVNVSKDHPKLSYTFVTETITPNAELIVAGLPTHPISKAHKVRFAVQWDNEPAQIVSFETYGRSEQWKQNVLRNLATVSIPVAVNKAGMHTVTIYLIDQGVCLDFIYLKTKPLLLPYALLPSTQK